MHRTEAQYAALMGHVGTALSSTSTLAERLDAAARAVVDDLDAAFCRVWVLDPDRDVLELRASAGLYEHIDGGHAVIPVGHNKVGQIAATRTAHLTNEVIGDPLVQDQAWVRREGMVSFAGYPLLLGDRCVGVIALFARDELGPHTLEALGGVADVLAVSIDQDEVRLALARENALVRSLLRFGQTVMSGLDLTATLDLVTGAAVSATSALAGAFVHEKGADFDLVTRSGISRTSFDTVAAEGDSALLRATLHHTETVRVDDLASDQRFGSDRLAVQLGEQAEAIRSYLAVPVRARPDQVIGGLLLGHRLPGQFTADDERIAEGIASFAAIALTNARLYRDLQDQLESRERVLHELDTAHERYRRLVEGIEAIVWEAELPDLRFSFVSQRAEQILGYPAQRWSEPGFAHDIVVAEDRDRAAAALGGPFAAPDESDVVLRMKAADGRLVHLRTAITPELDESGTPIRLRGVTVDVTDEEREKAFQRTRAAVNAVLAEIQEPDEAFGRILEALGAHLGFDFAALWVTVPEQQRIVCARSWAAPGQGGQTHAEQVTTISFDFGEGLPGRAWASRAPTWVEDFEDDADEHARVVADAGLRSGFGFPIVLEGEVFGIVECFSRHPAPPDDTVLDGVETIAAQLGQFLLRARSRQRIAQATEMLQVQSSQLEELVEISAALNRMQSPEDIVGFIGARARDLLDAAAGRAVLGEEPPPASDTRLVAPLTAADSMVIGFIEVDRPAITPQRRTVLAQLAEVASGAIQTTRLVHDRSRIAQALQRPLQPPSTPEFPGGTVATYYRPLGEGMTVGGDFFDFFPAAGGAWVATLGDVCGKGPEAAAVTGIARYSVWAAAQLDPHPEQVLRVVNQAIRREASTRFLTLAMATFTRPPNVDHLRAYVGLGGHPPPVLVRADGTVSLVEAKGDLLGVFDEVRTPMVDLDLRPGDTMIFYTDGLIEDRANSMDDDALVALVGRSLDDDPATMLSRMVAAADRRRQGTISDDLALLAIRAR